MSINILNNSIKNLDELVVDEINKQLKIKPYTKYFINAETKDELAQFNFTKIEAVKKHKLTTSELPKHRFKLAVPTGQYSYPPLTPNNSLATINNQGNDGNYVLGGHSAEPTVGQSSEVGGDLEHNNVQPSIVAHYIEWVGLAQQ